ncbi:DsbA family protein, partial [Candidatus Uhrbacteria bacterium]|nr:DsbA family protein [Candidatus Uhrbacteria bacterium]
GPLTAKVTVTEYLDYQCEGCAQFDAVMGRVREAYAGRVRFVVRHFPLVEGHPFSKGASIAAMCAQRQGAFFAYSSTLFTHQAALARADLEGYARDLGLDAAAFTSCLDDPTVADLVMADRRQGQELGVRQTPSIFLNDAMLSGIPSETEFRSLIDGMLGE